MTPQTLAEHRFHQRLRVFDQIARWAPWPEPDDRCQLGRQVELLGAEELRARGHTVILTTHKAAWDALAGGARVEIKAARRSYDRNNVRYQATIRNHRAHLLLLACVEDDQIVAWFVIPAAAVDHRRNIAIYGDPALYTGCWSPYRDRWDLADQIILEAGPHPAQLTLWGGGNPS